MNLFRQRATHKGKREEPLPQPNDGLPDSSRPQGLCPRCHKQSSFHLLGSLPVTFTGSYSIDQGGNQPADPSDQISSLVCRNCKQGVAVIEERWCGSHRYSDELKEGGVVWWKGISWWPLPEAQPSPDVPPQIASAFAEATLALAAGCPRASAVMARRTLEAVAVDKGETAGNLAQKLAALAEKNVLHPTLAEWAREVRLVANAAAHPDPIDEVSLDDARQLASFVADLLRLTYELPADLARRRQSAT